MGIVIGPVLRRADGYIFATWTASKGVIRGYPYRRIEDAHYARNAEIKASAQGRAPSAIVCQTLDEFIAKSTGYEMLAAARLGLRGIAAAIARASFTSRSTSQPTRASPAFLPARNS